MCINKLKFILFGCLIVGNLELTKAQFRINEYSFSNQGAVNDPLGGVGPLATPDWVEIYNFTTIPRNITGWWLSDDRNNLRKWQFPLDLTNNNITIPSTGYIKVFLCGHNAQPVNQELHANFQVNQTQGTPKLYITNVNATTPSDSVVIKRTQPNHSWGRYPNGGAVWRLYDVPTPAAANASTYYRDYCPKPTFSLPAGFYGGGSVTVSIDDPTPSTSPLYGIFEIWATTDCRVPVAADVIGTTQGQITTTTGGGTNVVANTVRAKIVDPTPAPGKQYLDSFEEIATYIIDSTYKNATICVCTDTTQLFSGTTNLLPSTLEYFEKDKKRKILSIGDAFQYPLHPGPIAFRQKPFYFHAEDEYGYNYTNIYQFHKDPKLGLSNRTDFPLLGFRAGGVENFPNGGYPANSFGGASHVRDFFNHTYALRKGLKFDAQHYQPVYMILNGMPFGVYYNVEPYDSTYTKYYYNKENVNFLVKAGTPVALHGNTTSWNSFFTYFINPLFDIHKPYAMNTVDSAINRPSLYDYLIYNMYAVNTDFDNRYAAWWEGLPDSTNNARTKWRWALMNTDNTWGFNLNNSIGLPILDWTSSPCDYEMSFAPTSPVNPLVPIWRKLMQNDTLRDEFITRYSDLVNTTLSCDSLNEHLTYIRDQIKVDMKSHVWFFANDPNCPSWPNCGDSLKYWNDMVDSMKMFINKRCKEINNVIATCYNKPGPYNLCIDIDPPNSGVVKLNSLYLNTFVWNGKYFDSITNTAIAIPDTNYVFDHWETQLVVKPSSSSDTITFFVNRDVCLKAIFKLKPAHETTGEPMIPTAFSPNGDGYNDIFNVYGTLNATSFEMDVFNRWGQQVFHSSDKSVGWDGRFNGAEAPAGVYAYRYSIKIGDKTYANKGSVTLLR